MSDYIVTYISNYWTTTGWVFELNIILKKHVRIENIFVCGIKMFLKHIKTKLGKTTEVI